MKNTTVAYMKDSKIILEDYTEDGLNKYVIPPEEISFPNIDLERFKISVS